jgi:hypothetical protein
MLYDLNEHRSRGFDIRIRELDIHLERLRADIAEVEQGNAELIAEKRRRGFRLVKE